MDISRMRAAVVTININIQLNGCTGVHVRTNPGRVHAEYSDDYVRVAEHREGIDDTVSGGGACGAADLGFIDYRITSLSETIRKPPLVKAQTALKTKKNKI